MKSQFIKEIYKDKGLTGLQNLGNTCYLNSVIQSLSHTYELHDFFDDISWAKRVKNNFNTLLLVEFDKLIKLMWGQNCVIAPKGFVSFVQKLAKKNNNSNFSGWDQNDASEFLVFLLDGFHKALSRNVNISINGKVSNETDKIALKCCSRFKDIIENDYSEMVDIFYGMQATVIYDRNGGGRRLVKGEAQSIASEPFFVLSVPVSPTAETIYKCLDIHTEIELLEGDNQWFNEDTGKKQDAIKQLSFWSLPKVLIIDMKRYNYNGTKNQRLIDFPLEGLDMRPYVIGYDKNKYIYDCYAVCNHSGNMGGGHYTAYVKNANGKWYHFNDNMVKEIRTSTVVSPKAYCLFYRLRS
jgi:ubiquitin carboxyl-terminal hydrolase 8